MYKMLKIVLLFTLTQGVELHARLGRHAKNYEQILCQVDSQFGDDDVNKLAHAEVDK